MRQAEDLVWSAIAESGKSRLDFAGFKKSLGLSGDERTAEYILFQMIVGFAEQLSHEELLSDIRADLLLFGYVVAAAELEPLLAGSQTILEKEIRAAGEALSGFSIGTPSDAVLVKICNFFL